MQLKNPCYHLYQPPTSRFGRSKYYGSVEHRDAMRLGWDSISVGHRIVNSIPAGLILQSKSYRRHESGHRWIKPKVVISHSGGHILLMEVVKKENNGDNTKQ